MSIVVVRPLITEKSLLLAGRGWYTFGVGLYARKEQIKKAVAEQYKVKVVDIRSIRLLGKKRRVGRKSTIVQKADWKKAMVRLAPGQKIDAFTVVGGEETKKE
jgi:large subunit ribosomal protein L23